MPENFPLLEEPASPKPLPSPEGCVITALVVVVLVLLGFYLF